MKNTKLFIAIILTLLLSGLLASCQVTNRNPDASGNVTDTSTPAMASAETGAPHNSPALPQSSVLSPSHESSSSPPPSAAPASGVSFEEKAYSSGTVTIKYPQLTGMSDSAAQEKLNKIISDAALRDVNDLQSGTEYELNYKVTLNSPSVISMYFDGYMSTPGAAHPNQFLRTLTLDVEKQETIRLPTLVSINEGFVEVMLNGVYSSMGYDMTDDYRSSIKDNLTSMGTDFWLKELRNADTPGYATSSYLTEDALVISVSVPHVMGDHVEITLSFKDLWGYQTDNLIWKEIEG